MNVSAEVEERARRVKLLLMDCDGVLTDGCIQLHENGNEQKTFHVRDGHGLVLFHRSGLVSAIISGRSSVVVERRALELGIKHVRQGSWNKIKEYVDVLSEAGVDESEVAVMGDDVTDIPLMQRCGLAVAVADAVEEVRHAAHYVTVLRGGHGAVREVIELILKAQGRWEELMRRYIAQQPN
jgi:3-deoxy-D-manno-octulosonate 8-phosphate phosphatase (KDO 8-P phosphatase)